MRLRWNDPHFLLLLVFRSSLQDGRDVVREPELIQGLGDVITCDGLFGFFLAYLVCLGGDQCYKLDATFYEQVTSFF